MIWLVAIACIGWGWLLASWWARNRARRNARKRLRRHLMVQVFVPYKTVRTLEDSFK